MTEPRPTAVRRPAPVSAADPARAAAYQTLMAVHDDDAYANLVLPRLLGSAGLTGRDAALATELAYGTLRGLGTLDEVIRRCSTRDLHQIEAGVLALLRLGSHQLLRTRIPPHAAVASTVDLARAVGHGRSAGFVNAVLRKVAAADYDTWCSRIGAGSSPAGRLALRHSHPGWIVAAFADALGVGQDDAGDLAELEQALRADDERPHTHLAAWPGRIDADALAAQAGGERGPYSPYAVRLSDGGEPGALTAVREHQAGVQDEGSQLCAIALTRLAVDGPDRRWLDLCAGPGGKAALLAAIAAEREAELTAVELHPHRAELLRAHTAGWPVQVVAADAREFAAGRPAEFDRVLLDAPCTGLGALRRRPEARWRRHHDDLAALTRLQAELLDAALRLVRPGGVVGYVTCSPHLAETRGQVRSLLQRDHAVEMVDARWTFQGVEQPGDANGVQLWPHRHGTDAMFFAALRRTR